LRAATIAGSVVGLSGQITLERGGQRYSLRMGEPVYVDDTVQVPGDAKLKLRMSDGSILSLAPGTVMRIDAYVVDGSGRRQAAGLSLGQGLLRSVTAPVDRPASFEVNTAVGTASVRSTDWFVDAVPSSEQVSVLTGSVSLASRTTGRAATIPAGWGTRLDAGRDPEPPRVWTPAEFAELIARTEGGASPAPPPGPGYYPYPPGGSPYYPPGGIIQIPIPLPGGDGYHPRPDGPGGDGRRYPGGRDSFPR